jgi:hypothetical protein
LFDGRKPNQHQLAGAAVSFSIPTLSRALLTVLQALVWSDGDAGIT